MERRDGWPINYVGHPIHGAAAGFIWLGSRRGDEAGGAFSKASVASRGQAALFAAAYSLQFEVGPISEASIGNIGMRPGTTGWVDHIVTPVGALGRAESQPRVRARRPRPDAVGSRRQTAALGTGPP